MIKTARFLGGISTLIARARWAPMENEAHRVVERFTDLFNRKEVDRFDEVVGVEYKQHVKVLAQGLDGAKRAARNLYAIFPDIRGEIEHVLAERDVVVGRFRWWGTHSAPFLGFEATGAYLEWTSSDWWRIRDGKLVEHWDNLDLFGITEQLRKALGRVELMREEAKRQATTGGDKPRVTDAENPK